MAAKEQKQKKGESAESAEASAGPRVPQRLETLYREQVLPQLAEKFGLKNPMQWPTISAVIVNVNMGKQLDGGKIPPALKETVLDTLKSITGQKPVLVLAKKSVSNFKVREGMETAARVTIRRDRMWAFLDRFMNLACPRIKDFRGLKETAFDRQGNYSVGLNEQGVFPEIDMGRVSTSHGMNINIVIENSTPEISRFILEELGMPFRKPEAKNSRTSAA